MTLRRAIWLVVALCALLYWLVRQPTAEAAAQPINWRRDPLQQETTRQPFTVTTRRGPARLTPRASFDAAGVVASVEPYWLDAASILSPLDLGLTWGELPTARYRERIDYSQNWRMLERRWSAPDLPFDYINEHSANFHLIPANRNLRRALGRIGSGDEVRVVGLLVDVRADNGFSWSTSLVRTDHGDTGCEVIWVEALQIGERIYR